MSEISNSLPESFLTNIRELLGDEYKAFISSYSERARRGLRLNLLKAALLYENKTPEDTQSLYSKVLPSTDHNLSPLAPVPWCKEGYEYLAQSRPAKSILYSAGLFYIQEPSAMCPAAVLSPKPGQKVLDLCAAPGGKSVQLAGYMQGQGLLVSNDASPSRSRALVKNLEMAGVTNAVVLTEMPHRLGSRFEGFFDCILVDAPCSGEGMFRRDPDAAKAYTANKPEACAALQQEILHHAAKMLAPGGRMVYSTCTFNTMENEGTVSAFLSSHSDFELLSIDHATLGVSPGGYDNLGISNGCSDTGVSAQSNGLPMLRNTARIWPHKAPGEGHFVALFAKKDSIVNNEPTINDTVSKKLAEQAYDSGRCKDTGPTIGTASFPDFKKGPKLPEEFLSFCNEALNIPASTIEPTTTIITSGGFRGNPESPNPRLYLQPSNLDLTGLRVARSGWLLGECTKNRFIPSQALAMGITKDQARYSINLPEPEAQRYLKGESLPPPEGFPLPSGKPWVLICYNRHPLGWARLVQGRLKNQLPTSWTIS